MNATPAQKAAEKIVLDICDYDDEDRYVLIEQATKVIEAALRAHAKDTERLDITEDQRLMILGALDSLGVALANYKHQWTIGEREIYDAAIECLGRRNPPLFAMGTPTGAANLENLARETAGKLMYGFPDPDKAHEHNIATILAFGQRAVAEANREHIRSNKYNPEATEVVKALTAQLAEQKGYADEYIRQTDAQIDSLAAQLAAAQEAWREFKAELENDIILPPQVFEKMDSRLSSSTVEQRVSKTRPDVGSSPT